jgi:hypothetical protein
MGYAKWRPGFVKHYTSDGDGRPNLEMCGERTVVLAGLWEAFGRSVADS